MKITLSGDVLLEVVRPYETKDEYFTIQLDISESERTELLSLFTGDCDRIQHFHLMDDMPDLFERIEDIALEECRKRFFYPVIIFCLNIPRNILL